ncbi:histidine kinase N-terminal domain-containing protein [Evansella sp. AB-rgal1]|uniref:histidine kinase N-terminal domain-containing protein n=1 Tax=Evansella sp. AB-rgal1 TaxID=3242696 RepID=UPI00359CC4FA
MKTFSSNTKGTFSDVIEYFHNKQTELLDLWEQNILIDDNTSNRKQVRENAYQMYTLVMRALSSSISEVDVKNLAYKVAEERIKANINIGEFVYNVNSGNSLIINHLIQAKSFSNQLQEIIEIVNELFDQFTYYAVSKYTDLKDKELAEKNNFIQQSHKDRLTILGQMSSSFVHEFRNPLTAIIGFNKLLREEYPEQRYLRIIEGELQQLDFQITQFLHTSKLNVIENKMEEVKVKEMLTDILTFLYPSIVDGDVNVKTKYETEPSILTNKEELRQVFLNILFNSIDALILRGKNKQLEIRCSSNEEYLRIIISNNGPAIPKEIQSTIFEPFYTTKKLGTGIGLFVCKKIVEKYEGEILCESNQHLTSFTVKLPLS